MKNSCSAERPPAGFALPALQPCDVSGCRNCQFCQGIVAGPLGDGPHMDTGLFHVFEAA